MPIALLLRLVTSVAVAPSVSIIPYPRQSAEQRRLAAECVVNPIDKKVLPFARVEQERKPSCHNLFLDAELVITVEQAVMAFQVDAGRIFPFWRSSRHAGFVVFFEEAHQAIPLLRVGVIYRVPG
jgi:hypothetical protein